MQIESVAQVEHAENGEDVCLQREYDHFEGIDRDIDQDRQKKEITESYGEARKDDHQRVLGHHIGEEPDRQCDRTRQIGDDLDRDDQRRHDQGRPFRQEKAEEMEAMPDERHDRHQQEQRQRRRDDDLGREGIAERYQRDQIAEQQEREQREDEREERAAFGSEVLVDHAGGEFVDQLGDRLQPSGDELGAARGED